ncbi:TetR/AcrR family transcriptional regulator [Pseudomonas sp. REP124]|uniref:TetR/AcrR family transcriptional regulator n=1 Tax=Pseudomonas sp. REP124 TaxID=2875731 RepID=UPI001CCBE6E1|nr:TetR/AcrR family transcriptional regulator [Pseudomonas sp. REP124]MBZ9783660.1 TetR/AcrR family transcriptional regulator [Pseudomonas sp. REP124]
MQATSTVHSDTLSPKARMVVAGAREIFLAHGFSAATTDMIQRAAGVSKSTVYAYYPTKEKLFEAVVEAECEAAIQAVHSVAMHLNDLRDVLSTLARAYMTIFLSPSGLALFRAIIGEAPRFPQLARHFYLVGPSSMNNLVAQHIERSTRIGELDVSSVGLETAASIFTNLVRSEAQMQCLTHPGSVPSAAQQDQWINTAVVTFLRAFGTSNFNAGKV